MSLPLCSVGLLDAEGRQQLVHRPFITSNLYNWKLQNPKFSEKPDKLIDLLDSVLFTHQPTWDCYQLPQILFTMEKREQIVAEAWKMVLGPDRRPTTIPDLINAEFPPTRPN